MPKVFGVLGDSHANRRRTIRALEVCVDNGISTILQCGDFGYFPRAANGERFLEDVSNFLVRNNMELSFISGNHEDYDSIEGWVNDHENWRTADEPKEVMPNLYYLPDAYVWDNWGVTIGVLGGGTSIDKDMRTEGWDWFPQEVVSESSAEKLSEHKLDILMTHDCGGGILDYRYVESNKNLSDEILFNLRQDDRIIGEVRKATEPQIHVCGHHHIQHSHKDGDTMLYGLTYDGHTDGWLAVIDTNDMRLWHLRVL